MTHLHVLYAIEVSIVLNQSNPFIVDTRFMMNALKIGLMKDHLIQPAHIDVSGRLIENKYYSPLF
jgi:hypothetical protein